MLQVNYPFRQEFFGGIIYDRYSTRGGYTYLNETAFKILNLLDVENFNIKDFVANNDLQKVLELFRDNGLIKENDTKIRRQIGNYSNLNNSNGLVAPTSIDLYPAFHCNYRCKFCYVGSWVENPGNQFLQKGQISGLVDRIQQAGIFHVGILGGEPTLYKHIDSLLDELHRINTHISIATNGTNDNEQLINRLVEYNVDVNVSVQGGNSSIHDKIVKNSGSFLKVTKFINRLRASNKRFLISCVLNKQNAPFIEQYIGWCASMGATDVSLFFPERTVYTFENGMALGFTDFVLALAKAKSAARPYGINVDSNCHFDFLINENFSGFEQNNPLAEYLYGDKAFSSRLDVMSDGSVYPNYEFFGMEEFKLGNIFQTPVQELWNSEAFNTIKSAALTLPNVCKTCIYRSICRGGFISRKVKNQPNSENPEYCPLIDENLSVALINEIYESAIY